MKIPVAIVCGLVAVSVFLGGCGSSGKIVHRRNECPVRVTLAIKKFKTGKYQSAKTILEEVKIQCAGHECMDTAEYYLAQSYLAMKLYLDAKLEFTRLDQDYPRSPFREEARFRVAYCVFKAARPVDRDQTETRDALKLLHDYLENNPSGPFADSAQKYLIIATEKLAEKEFNSARFYQRLGEKEAAVVYYKCFLANYPGSRYAAPARLAMGEILLSLSRKAEAKEVLDELVAQEKSGETVRKAQELLARINSGN